MMLIPVIVIAAMFLGNVIYEAAMQSHESPTPVVSPQPKLGLRLIYKNQLKVTKVP